MSGICGLLPVFLPQAPLSLNHQDTQPYLDPAPSSIALWLCMEKHILLVIFSVDCKSLSFLTVWDAPVRLGSRKLFHLEDTDRVGYGDFKY